MQLVIVLVGWEERGMRWRLAILICLNIQTISLRCFFLPMRTFLWNAFDNIAMSTVDSFGTVEVCRNKRSSVPRHFLMYSPDEGLGGTETLCFLYLIAGINVSRVLRLFVYCYYVPWNGTHTFL